MGGGGPAGPRTVRGTEAARVRAGSRPAAGSGPANTFSGLMSRCTKPWGTGGGEAKLKAWVSEGLSQGTPGRPCFPSTHPTCTCSLHPTGRLHSFSQFSVTYTIAPR